MTVPVIVGSGLAGLATALHLERPCVLVAPGGLGVGASSALAQGGLAAAIGADDSVALHAADTIAAGDGLCDAQAVRSIVAEGPDVVAALARMGVSFDEDETGDPDLHLEAAHSRARIVHAGGDGSGAAIMRALVEKVRERPEIEVIEGWGLGAIRLRQGAVAGVELVRGTERRVLRTHACVLATGGVGGLYRPTTTPTGLAGAEPGSGLAAAARAGALLADLEFVQFHPTALRGVAGAGRWPLVSEAVRGAGAVLVDETGARFTEELAPRDVVARAIAAHMRDGHAVFLDARARIGASFSAMFPGIAASCQAIGVDPEHDPIPVQPAVHYHMGGIVTDLSGRTSVDGLWAVGEAGCTGLHGANRLASNSLLEAFVMGRRAGLALREGAGRDVGTGGFDPVFLQARGGGRDTAMAAIGAGLGLLRDGAGLARAVSRLAPLAARSDVGLAGFLMARAALLRRESRGSHYRVDYPQAAPGAVRHMVRLADIMDEIAELECVA
ncbi:L-aspartate oxidase [Tanticharoenia sakaeratensis]|uniref:L-aspartate oxidase n=1 Tax=Tanticharoenia sakaeratensis NBRC 103193 TaxID=1231623 RepID=A0A0D6MMF8_9PROT|nr:L-aspartate oxidase [Tanticharoenia sakaeratensis]GAN54636.1 L-aspartate oxidase [Tanticharoenia sakaeratensis NBRC 103193]GBQ16677.1 succinate dehydrogenase flavoprotein subunit [Tanticharoenia sakaeratensis NBRC 103193]